MFANSELDRRAKGILRMAIWKADNIGADETLQISVGAKALCTAYPDILMDEALVHARELHKALADKQKKRDEYRGLQLQSRRHLDRELDFDLDDETDFSVSKISKIYTLW